MDPLLSVTDVQLLESNDYKKQLVEKIEDLINNSFLGLIQFLYKIDIDEQRLKELLNSKQTENSAQIIADLFIERQLQKVKSRQQFFKSRENISEEDKW